jgi:hypothetical protein
VIEAVKPRVVTQSEDEIPSLTNALGGAYFASEPVITGKGSPRKKPMYVILSILRVLSLICVVMSLLWKYLVNAFEEGFSPSAPTAAALILWISFPIALATCVALTIWNKRIDRKERRRGSEKSTAERGGNTHG